MFGSGLEGAQVMDLDVPNYIISFDNLYIRFFLLINYKDKEEKKKYQLFQPIQSGQ